VLKFPISEGGVMVLPGGAVQKDRIPHSIPIEEKKESTYSVVVRKKGKQKLFSFRSF